MTPRELAAAGSGLGFALPETALPVLAGYLDDLIRWNKVINLIGVSSWRKAFASLVVDSLYLARFLEQPGVLSAPAPECWDLGAGAGLPGIPLRAVWQRGSYWLIEAREKRALFLRATLARYPLPDTHVFHGRAEAFMDGTRRADVILSRAFMPWEKLLDFVAPQVRPAGRVILLLNEAITLPEASPWRVAARMDYTANGAARLFMALAKA